MTSPVVIVEEGLGMEPSAYPIERQHPGSYSYTKSTKSIHTKVSYSSWVKLFKLHAQGYNVLDLIDGTLAPAKIDTTYESWHEIDKISFQWIYVKLSNER
ncbi:hypothetical protein LXL04_006758 [Taraxacum kok-saghyz]